MSNKTNLKVVTFGVISLIASVIGIIAMIVHLVHEYSEHHVHTYTLLIAIGAIILLIIIGLYVRMTNFGIQEESGLEKAINDKRKLKEEIEIAKLEIYKESELEKKTNEKQILKEEIEIAKLKKDLDDLNK